MGLTQLNFAGKNKIEVAIMRLQEFEPPEGYYLAFSGGKDSVVIYDLAIKSGVKFDAHYTVTGIDPPELMSFIKVNYPDVIWDKPEVSFWKAFLAKGYPGRHQRWCCTLLKERNGENRRVVTGIRWQESGKRKSRRIFELCQRDETKYFLNPIIDWTAKMNQTQNKHWIKSGDIWEYIDTHHLPYCSLYNEGFKRLGCILCPMGTAKQAQIQIKRFPKTALAWEHAFERLYELGREGHKRFGSGKEMFRYWLSRKGEPKVDKAQCIMFDN